MSKPNYTTFIVLLIVNVVAIAFSITAVVASL